MQPALDLDKFPPPGSWDSHVHIVDEDAFPLHPLHPYRPMKAPLSSLLAFHQKVGILYPCIIAFSVYHTDNSSILDALGRLGGRARAVACINPETATDQELQTLHQAGVRGIRLNMRTRGDSFNGAAVKSAADRVRPLGWAIQLYVSLKQVTELAPLVPELGVPIVIDHIGAPEASGGPIKLQPGYTDFMELLRTGRVWTKLSGTYRFPDLPDLDEYVTDILRKAPDRVVWGSDWPHSGGVEANPGGDRKKVQEYRKVDDAAWVARCRQWCREIEGANGDALARKIWVENPRILWQHHGND
ncbi:related to TIM barrel metal-dependent hydrolase [Cephalotrichum gorgonifer]|uniref:Related to TIM barrel metal-dependent hydrolase n=1 Tax=Cephalotrichum gorgonifer TaxID=2041049 RepID=A0AAE8SZD7_9PEZI|nr:related to TIM barrel metal-dependent hydrolase [Cephalotrichum gorgonifer]